MLNAASIHTSKHHSIEVCCAWGRSLTDGKLKYKIIGGDAVERDRVRNAINKWNSKLDGIEIIEIPNSGTDIEVNFVQKAAKIQGYITNSGEILKAVEAAQTVNNFDESGFIINSITTVSRSAFGNTFNSDKIEQITEHEIGHALGLGMLILTILCLQ